MTDGRIIQISRRMLKPYRISRKCPYLSEDQRELSQLDIQGRSAWMAEWLLLAAAAPNPKRISRSWADADERSV
jgi:hypothetical protein